MIYSPPRPRFLLHYLYSITVRICRPSYCTVVRPPGPWFEPGTDRDTDHLTTRPPHLLVNITFSRFVESVSNEGWSVFSDDLMFRNPRFMWWAFFFSIYKKVPQCLITKGLLWLSQCTLLSMVLYTRLTNSAESEFAFCSAFLNSFFNKLATMLYIAQ